jgi:hypothetical protein
MLSVGVSASRDPPHFIIIPPSIHLNGVAMTTVNVNVKADALTGVIGNFDHQPLTRPLFLNSVPKCGSHLLRNIIRMFVPVEQQYHVQFIQPQIFHQHYGAFADERNFLSWGHLTFTNVTAIALGNVRQILLVRDPYDWVLASARFFISDQFAGFELLKEGTLSIEAILNMVIVGIPDKAPPLRDLFLHNAVAWLGTGVHLVRYEDLVAAVRDVDSDHSKRFFTRLFEACGIERPDDWRERVRIGSDRKHSWTARENLTGMSVEIPAELPEVQKNLVNFTAPGLRELLGYD